MQKKDDKKYKGIIYRASDSCGRIVSMSIPDDYPDIFIVGATELGSCNYFDAFGNIIQIFADGIINYPGQPLFAVFGTNNEAIELFCRRITYSTEPFGTEFDPDRRQYIWNSGETDSFFDLLSSEESKEKYSLIHSQFIIKRHKEEICTDRKFRFSFSNGRLSADVETLWPVHFKKTIIASLGLEEENFEMTVRDTYSSFDQMTYKPLIIALPAAWVALKKECTVEISSSVSAFHPELKYEIDSVVSMETSEIIASKAVVNADLGAFYVLENEYANSLFAGLTTLYKTKKTEVVININKSVNPPSNLFRGLGYAPSVAAMEHHSQIIASSLGLQPNSWKINNIDLDSNASYHDVFRVDDISNLSKTIIQCCENSDYNRKYSVYRQKNISGFINPALNYTRGIGMACAGGVTGFSSLFNKLGDFSLLMTLDENRITVNCGMYSTGYAKKLWMEIIREHFPEVLPKNIVFSDFNNPQICDLGPEILERNITIVPKLIEEACNEINRKKNEGASLPISVASEIIKSPRGELYDMDSFGTVVIDLFIDPVKLNPVIYSVFAVFHFGIIEEKELIARMLKQTITQTIQDICPDASVDYQLSLSITSRNEISSDLGVSLAKGITMAAVGNALTQALEHDIHKLPITPEDVLGVIRQKENDRK